jgi:hypothetical protein
MNEISARILTELHDAARAYPDWAAILAERTTLHIAVTAEPFLSYIFVGKKTVESRFSIHRITPYGHVNPGDIVLMKSGGIVGCFTVSWVELHDLTLDPLEDIAAKYGDAICGDADFWAQKSDKRYATLMGIDAVRRLPPVSITKADRRAWLTLPVEEPSRS